MGVCTSTKNFKTEFSTEEIGDAMKQSLDLAAKFAESKTAGGGKFTDNEAIRIHLPDELLAIKTQLDRNQEKVDQMKLDKVIDDTLMQEFNVGERLVDLEIQMNKSAEQACIGVAKVFIQTIQEISVESVMELLKGDDNAAFTAFLRQECEAPLTTQMMPIIEKEMEGVGFTQTWAEFQEKYKEIKEKLSGGTSSVKAMAMGALKAVTGVSSLPEIEFDMNGYLVKKIMEALFGFLAEKETEMRKAPKLVTNDLVAGVLLKYCGKQEEAPKNAEADPEQVDLSEKEPLIKVEDKVEAEEGAAAAN